MRMRDILKRATLVAAMTGAVPAGATELKMVIGNGPQHDGTKVMEQWAGDLETRTDGALTARVFPATLVTVKEIPAGLKSGLADIGQIVYPYHPAEFPEAAFISDFSLFATSNVAAAGAMAEYMLTCTDCREELHRNGLVYFGGLANAPYSLLATKRIVSLEDFKGLRVRSGGDAWGRWIEGLGGIKVSIPSQDAYQALSQGMLDAHTHSIGSLIDQSLVDVVTDVTDIPAGVYFGAAWNFSKKSWDALSDDERAILFERAPYGLALSNTTLELSRRKVMDQLAELNIALHHPDDSLMAANRAFLEEEKARIVAMAPERYGVENAADKADRFLALLDKWEKLAADTPLEAQAVGDLYTREIYSHLTPADL